MSRLSMRRPHLIITAGLIVSIISSLFGGDYSYMIILLMIIILAGLVFVSKALGYRSYLYTPMSLATYSSSWVENISNIYLKNCWILILLTWIFGVLRGLSFNVPVEFVFRNFFGMVVYCVLPILMIFSISVKMVIEIISYASIFVMAFMLYTLIIFVLNSPNLEQIGSLSELRSFYSSAAMVLFPLFAISAASVFYRGWQKNTSNGNWITISLSNKWGFFIILILIVLPSMSKGMVLSCLLLLFTAYLLGLASHMRHGFIPRYFIASVILIPIGLYFTPQFIFDVVFFTFSSEEVSNSIRSDQASYLIAEFSTFGQGLGSSLVSGYVRDDSGYGFELNYLNLIHKFGIFSLPIFMSYFFTVGIAFYRIWRRKFLFESYIALGLMGFLVVGAGNPILLSSISVTLHTFAIYILLNTRSTLR